LRAGGTDAMPGVVIGRAVLDGLVAVDALQGPVACSAT
jgi:hypothetical protein